MNNRFALSALLRDLRNNKSGTSFVEFAFVAPILITIIVGIIEISMIMLVSALVEGGVREAARFGLTGSTPPGMSREEFITQRIQDITMGFIQVDDSNVTVSVYPSFGDIGQPEPFTDQNANATYDTGEPYTDINGNNAWDNDMGQAGAGGPGEVVLYRIDYEWPLMFGLLAATLGPTMQMSTSMAVRNEPYLVGGGT